jgi:hypothetical protein
MFLPPQLTGIWVFNVGIFLPPQSNTALATTIEHTCQHFVSRATSSPPADPQFLSGLRYETTSLLAEIFPMHELTEITGHKDPRILMRYYHRHGGRACKKVTIKWAQYMSPEINLPDSAISTWGGFIYQGKVALYPG